MENKCMSQADPLLRQFAALHRLKTRVDVDSTTIIPGRLGHIYEYDPDAGLLGVMFMPPGYHKGDKRWFHARAKLQKAGLKIVQNGDSEGAATFDPLNRVQSTLAITIARVKPKRIMSEKQRQVALVALKRAQEQKNLPGQREEDAFLMRH